MAFKLKVWPSGSLKLPAKAVASSSLDTQHQNGIRTCQALSLVFTAHVWPRGCSISSRLLLPHRPTSPMALAVHFLPFFVVVSVVLRGCG